MRSIGSPSQQYASVAQQTVSPASATKSDTTIDTIQVNSGIVVLYII